jgi:DNA-binding response OmpR family regulator
VNLEIQNRIDQNLFVSLDADKFETIINNLLSNAIKFTDSGKKVVIDAAVSEKTLLLYVKDEGIGFPKGDEEKIFERFYQSEQRSSDLSGGTGVGLALSKEITELLGGKISAVNNITEGCTLTLVLPLIETTKEGIVEEASFIKEEQVEYIPILINGERPRILIVEDNKDMREYISSILDPYYECSFASDGYECLKMIQRETFDIISSDVMMPRMDGFTLKSKINEIERLSQIPFIFLTARILEEDKIQGLNLGVDDYITKPFNKREYLTRIDNLLKNKKSREEDDENTEESVDRRLLKRAEAWVFSNLDNTSIKVQDLADELNTSQRQLSRNIKKLIGLTPVNFILEIRLQKAYQLILEKRFSSVAEVRFEVGIESASYFTRKFKERFGLLPSEVR